MKNKIDYLITIFRNYSLLDIQRELFERYNPNEYRLVIVDNTPDSEKKHITPKNNELILQRNSLNEFDGVSHGSAIDYGLEFIESEIVCILDSDFFLFDRDINQYVINNIKAGYEAIGPEFGAKAFRDKHPEKFDGIPMVFCYFCKTKFAKKYTWKIEHHELDLTSSYIETGWRFRKHILENKTKVLSWKIDNIESDSKQTYKNENEKLVGMHYFAGSSVRIHHDFRGDLYGLYGQYI